MKFNKRKNSVPYSHYPHLKCLLVTHGWLALCSAQVTGVSAVMEQFNGWSCSGVSRGKCQNWTYTESLTSSSTMSVFTLPAHPTPWPLPFTHPLKMSSLCLESSAFLKIAQPSGNLCIEHKQGQYFQKGVRAGGSETREESLQTDAKHSRLQRIVLVFILNFFFSMLKRLIADVICIQSLKRIDDWFFFPVCVLGGFLPILYLLFPPLQCPGIPLTSKK